MDENLNKELIKIMEESKQKVRKKKSNTDKALERINAHIEILYNNAKEETRIAFEFAAMNRLIDNKALERKHN
jgi:hypothetical protein